MSVRLKHKGYLGRLRQSIKLLCLLPYGHATHTCCSGEALLSGHNLGALQHFNQKLLSAHGRATTSIGNSNSMVSCYQKLCPVDPDEPVHTSV